MSSAYKFIFIQIKLIFIRKVLHGTLACSSGVFRMFTCYRYSYTLGPLFVSCEFESKVALALSKCVRSLVKILLHCRLMLL